MTDENDAAGDGGEERRAPDGQGAELRALEERARAAERRAAELETRVEARDRQLAGLVVDGEIRRAAAESGLVAAAIDDALARGRQVFALDGEGRAVARDAEGAVSQGSDGKAPLTPAAWLEGLRAAAPHWWPPSSGSGAPGAGSAKGEAALSYEQAGQLPPERYARLRRAGKIT